MNTYVELQIDVDDFHPTTSGVPGLYEMWGGYEARASAVARHNLT